MTAQQSFFCESPQSPSKSSPIQFTLITAPSALTAILAALIQAKVSKNDTLPPASFEDMTVFHALEAPSISVADYVARVSKYVFCSEACLVAAYHYINKAIQSDPKLALTSLSVHRMFITAVVLACKYFDDVSYNLMYYSKVGGLPYKELANLEINMLRMLDFRLDISAKDFTQIESQMMTELARLRQATVDTTTTQLVKTAVHEFEESTIVPIDFELLSDEKEQIQSHITHRKPSLLKKLPTSPATSSVTDYGSKLSRNSSMASMPEEAEYCESAVVQSCADVFRKEHALSNSPTTPSLKPDYARQTQVSTSVY